MVTVAEDLMVTRLPVVHIELVEFVSLQDSREEN